MKKVATTVAVLTGALALPGGALANPPKKDCDYPPKPPVVTPPPYVPPVVTPPVVTPPVVTPPVVETPPAEVTPPPVAPTPVETPPAPTEETPLPPVGELTPDAPPEQHDHGDHEHPSSVNGAEDDRAEQPVNDGAVKAKEQSDIGTPAFASSVETLESPETLPVTGLPLGLVGGLGALLSGLGVALRRRLG